MNKNYDSPSALAADEDFQDHCFSPSRESQQRWSDWENASPERSGMLEKAKSIVSQLTLEPSPQAIESAYAQFQAKVSQSNIRTLQKRRRRFMVAAASLIALVTAGAWAWQKFNAEIPMQMVSTEFGKIQKLELADGSTVTLNANSILRFAEEFTQQDTRELWLDGEAYFEVAHQDGKPFIVHTQKGDVRVLGTSFNVSQRKADLEVTLVEGKVQLQLANETKINMQPNEQVRFSANTVDVFKADVESVTAWKQNRMVFKNVSIARIIERLGNDFGWTVKVNDKALLSRKVNAQIPKNDPGLLLEALSAIYDLKVEKVTDIQYVID